MKPTIQSTATPFDSILSVSVTFDYFLRLCFSHHSNQVLCELWMHCYNPCLTLAHLCDIQHLCLVCVLKVLLIVDHVTPSTYAVSLLTEHYDHGSCSVDSFPVLCYLIHILIIA